MRPTSRLARTALVIAGIGTAMTLAAAPALADQHGTNYCVSGVFAVHETPSMDSPVLTDIHANEVWHHYNTDGNWSVGYIRPAPTAAAATSRSAHSRPTSATPAPQ